MWLPDKVLAKDGMGVRLSELPLSPERNPELIPSAKGRQNLS